jgi:tetratricopeptide (TPR) repeat protein
MHEEQQNRLRLVAGGARRGAREDCPAADELAAVAAGVAAAERRDWLLDHASQCDVCGAALRALVEDFTNERDEPESQMLESLQSSKPEWQRAMARRMAGPSARKKAPFRTWLARAAAVTVALAGGWLAWMQWSAPSPERLLAQAYTERRPFDFRIPGAAYAPVSPQERGGALALQRPAELDDAFAAIKRQLKAAPESARALDMRGRAVLLENSPEDAIADFDHALETNPGDPTLLADLGMAYALRARLHTDRTVDYAPAIDKLETALRARSDSPETVFNLALVYEDMNMVDKAIEEWNRYLGMDRSGAWHDEARRRLDALEQKKKFEKKP